MYCIAVALPREVKGAVQCSFEHRVMPSVETDNSCFWPREFAVDDIFQLIYLKFYSSTKSPCHSVYNSTTIPFSGVFQLLCLTANSISQGSVARKLKRQGLYTKEGPAVLGSVPISEGGCYLQC